MIDKRNTVYLIHVRCRHRQSRRRTVNHRVESPSDGHEVRRYNQPTLHPPLTVTSSATQPTRRLCHPALRNDVLSIRPSSAQWCWWDELSQLQNAVINARTWGTTATQTSTGTMRSHPAPPSSCSGNTRRRHEPIEMTQRGSHWPTLRRAGAILLQRTCNNHHIRLSGPLAENDTEAIKVVAPRPRTLRRHLANQRS